VPLAVIASGDAPLEAQGGAHPYRVDIRNREDVRGMVSEFRPTEIYHLAAITEVDFSWRNPSITFEVNVIGTQNVFEAGMGLPVPARILNVSTAHVYAPSTGTLIESSAVGPENPYAATKAMAELLAVQFRRSKTGGVITARSFNHSGPGQRTDFVLSSMAKQFAEMTLGIREPRLTIGNLDVERDFTDVRDVVSAYAALVEKGAIGAVYNVCSGKTVSLREVIRIFQDICGKEVELLTDTERVRSCEVTRVAGDCGRIVRDTGWRPQIPLATTLLDLMNFWRVKIESAHEITHADPNASGEVH